MINAPITKKHLNGLTGLRFWAAAFVMLYHFTSYLGPIPGLSEVTRFGNSGVTFFFVLSGVVLTWTYLDKRVPKRVFYWRRFARIWPLHILTTIISLLAWRLVDHPIGNAINVDSLWPAFFLLHSWSSDIRVIQGGSGASWSLSNEAFFYAIFPLVMVLFTLHLNRRTILLLPICLTLVAGLIWLVVPAVGIGEYPRAIFLSYFPLVRVTQFLAGMAFGIALKRNWMYGISFRLSIGTIVVYFVGLHLWSESAERTSFWYPQTFAQLLPIIPFGFLIVSAVQADLSESWHAFKGRFIELLGQASFALYLIHVPIALVWQYLFGKPVSVGISIIAWTVVSTVAVGCSILIYKFFEHPMERKLRGFVKSPAAKSSEWRIETPLPRSHAE